MSQTTIPPQPDVTLADHSAAPVHDAFEPAAPTQAPTFAPSDDISIRPFRVNVPDEAVADLRRRLQATRWPDMETVADQSQGPQLARLRELARYWASDYDWRKGKAKLNAFPQFKTNIDSV